MYNFCQNLVNWLIMNNHFFIEALLPSPTSHYSQTTTSTNCGKSFFCRISNINTIESQFFGVCTIMITLNHQTKTPIGFDVGKVQTLHQCHKLIGYWMFVYCMSVCYIAMSYIGHVLSWSVFLLFSFQFFFLLFRRDFFS